MKSADQRIDFVVELVNDSVQLKIQHPAYEVNVELPVQLLPQLENLPKWESGALEVGSVSGVPAFWSLDNGVTSILVGADDECWDFGVWFSMDALREILDECHKIQRPPPNKSLQDDAASPRT